MSISRRDPVTPLTPFLPNINLTKTTGNLLVASNVTKNSCNNFYFHPYTFHGRKK